MLCGWAGVVPDNDLKEWGMVRGIRVGFVAGLAAVAVGVAAAPAGAVTSVYHPNAQSRDFGTGNGGSTSSQEVTGLCIPTLQCPVLFNAWLNSDGTRGAGDGHLLTALGSLLGVAGESKGIWTGAPFVYNGAGGKVPDKLTLRIHRDVTLGALLAVVGNSADYSVELVDETANNIATRPIDSVVLSSTQGWTTAGPVAIDPEALTIGHTYRWRIITRFVYGAEVLPGASVGYDDVSLTAKTDGGGDGRRGGCADTPLSSACFDGRRLFINLKCYGVKKNGRCFTRATALKSKNGKRYTFPVQRKVKKRGKLVRARIRFRFRSELEQRRSIVLRSVLRTERNGKKQAIKHERLKLIKRGG
jgi:hypothetical protein